MSGTISGDFHSAELAGNGACVNTIGQTMSPGTLVRMSIGGLSLYLLIHAVGLLYAAVGRVKGNNQLTHLAIWGPRVPSQNGLPCRNVILLFLMQFFFITQHVITNRQNVKQFDQVFICVS